MESPPAPGSDRRRPPTPSVAASPPNGNQAGAGNIASGSGTIAGSQSSVGESEGGQAAGPGVVDPKYPLWAADLVFIHSAARNKLTPARAADLVFTHNNHRLFSRNSQAYLTGPSRMWDIGGDGVESFGGVGMLEGADLSLDEPALEEEIIDSLT